MSKNHKRKVDWLNHLVGLISVVFGVLIAFWLNSWSMERKEQREIRTALQNVKSEILRNQASLDSTITENKKQRDFLSDYMNYTNDKMESVVDEITWREMARKYPEFATEKSSSVRIDMDLFQLSEVAWATTNRTGILSSIDFELAFTLEETYDLQEKVNEFDADLIADLRAISGNKDSFLKVFRSLSLAIDLANSLKDKSYPKTIQEIDNYLK
jgi:hypothetical protein